MAQNYTSIADRNLAGGTNQQASEDSIPEGYVESALNVTINSDGLVKKRPGFRTYLGHLPLRTAKVSWDHTKAENNLTFELTSAEHANTDVDLSNVASTAILVVGRTSTPVGAGPEFNSSYSYRYYTGFAANPRKIIPANAAGTLSYPQAEHGYTTKDLFVGLAASTATTNKSNNQLWASSVTVSESSFDVQVGYDNDASPVPVQTFVYALPLSGIAGTSYAAVFTPTLVSGNVYKVSIPAATHNLNSFNILARCYIGDGSGTLTEAIPNEVYVNKDTGLVELFFQFQEGSPTIVPDVRVLLHIPNVGNQYIDSIQGLAESSFTIPNIEGDFLFLDCFIESGSLRRRVIPTDVQIDVLAATATVTFDNEVNSSDILVLLWDYAVVKTTKFSVTAHTNLVTSGQDLEPELSIYGILAEEVYPAELETQPYNAWVQHIDTYRTEGNTTVVAGMGWNLFRGISRATPKSYLPTPTLYPSLRARAKNATILAPAFHDVDQAVKRTRGAFRFTGGGEGWARVHSIVWDSEVQGYAVTLATPGINQVGTPAEAFTSTQPFGDMLTLKGAELRSFDGEWPLLAKNNEVVIYVTLPYSQGVTFFIRTPFQGSDYNCGPSGEAGIFTDQLQLETSTPLLLSFGDSLTAQSIPTGMELGFIGFKDQASVRYTFVNGVTEEATLSPGQLLIASRQSKYCYGLRTLEGSITGFNQTNNLLLVKGDSLEITGTPVPIEVAQVLSQSYTNLTLSIEDGVATLSGLADARQFAIGQRVLLTVLGYYSGEYAVTEVSPNNTSILLDCTGIPDITLTGVSIPPHFQLREAVSLADDFFNRSLFQTEGRWEAIEKPQIDTPNLARYALVEPTVTEHFNALDYGAQLPLRSTMSQDSLYLTNSFDPVQKYDGIATYRAGLPRWNAQMYMTNGSSPASPLAAGTYGYYFRLSAFDENENVIISAITGAEDYRITIQSAESIHLRMLGFPNWDDYDFEKLSLEVYRTKVNLPGEYFLVTRLEMPQTPSGGYIDYVDILSDDVIVAQGKDNAINATYGLIGLATTLSEPLRAKYITSIDNRIVLANIRDWQRVELNFSKLTGLITSRNDTNPPDSTTYDFYGKTLTIHNDSTDLATATDMHNRVTYEFRVRGQHYVVTAQSYNSTTKIFSATLTVPAGQAPQVGDWIYLMNHHATPPTSYYLEGVGLWQIREVDATVPTAPIVRIYMPKFDTTVPSSINFASTSATPGSKNVPVYIDVDDYSYTMIGGNSNDIVMILRRLASYVNASMRMVDVAIPGFENFKPWIMADAGSEFPAGQINFVRPKESSTFFSITVPSFTEASQIKVASFGRFVTGRVTAIQRRFPSRILPSYRNFPEVFNRAADLLITAAEDAELSPIDVNAADGQEITGIVPFFGESAFGGSQREEQLVVFKTNSIYLVDLRTKGVQKLQSNGLGCTAPYSIAPTKDGIMFANESGVYKLTRGQTVEPVGQFVDRIWQEETERNLLEIAHGHHYGNARQYKLSFPLAGQSENSHTLVYEHTRESRGQIGAWTRDTNQFSTGWCNLFDQEFFATSLGRVCVMKNSRTKWDYSDRGEPVSAEVLFRSNDFGIPNSRKRLLHLSVHFRNPQEEGVNLSQESTEVYIAEDLKEDFAVCNKYTGSGLFVKTGLSDQGLLKGETIRFSVPTSKAIRFQPKVLNAGLYETLQFSGVTYRVAGLTTKGTKEAADSEN